ncbi:MAG: hypothetical protein AAF734_00810 [Bacteroidota bacterium]
MNTNEYIYNEAQEVVGLKDPNRANWRKLSKEERLSKDFMIEYADFLDWNQISAQQPLDLYLMQTFYSRIKWKKIAQNPHISDDLKLLAQYKLDTAKLLSDASTLPTGFVERNYLQWGDQRLCWINLSSKHTLSEAFIHRFRYLVDWLSIYQSQTHLSENFLVQYESYLPEEEGNIDTIPIFKQLTKEIILDDSDRMNWSYLFRAQQFSETFLQKLAKKVGKYTLFWKYLSAHQPLSDDFILQNQASIDWTHLSQNKQLTLSNDTLLQLKAQPWHWYYLSSRHRFSSEAIEQLKDKINWDELLRNQTGCITEEIIERYKDYFKWDVAYAWQPMSEALIRRLIKANCVDWYKLSVYQNPVLSMAFFEEFEDNIYWDKIQPTNSKNRLYGEYAYERFSEDFIKKFSHKLDWYLISGFSPISEALIEKMASLPALERKIHWPILFMRQAKRLSPAFLEKYAHKVDWKDPELYAGISESAITALEAQVDWHQVLQAIKSRFTSSFVQYSEAFLEKYRHLFKKKHWKQISKTQKLSEDFIREHQDKLDWKFISRYQKLSEDLLNDFEALLHWPYIEKYQSLSPRLRRQFAHQFSA